MPSTRQPPSPSPSPGRHRSEWTDGYHGVRWGVRWRTSTSEADIGSDVPDDGNVFELPQEAVESSLVDARRFLEVTGQLRDLYARVDGARVSAEQKGRWHRRLIAITDAARDDLDRAEGQLVRFSAELDRHLRR